MKMCLMKRAILYGTVIAGIAVMMMSSILPAMALQATGVVVSINPAEKHGVIERTDDGSGTLYQFNIPRDTVGTVLLGDDVTFTVDPENSRHATNVDAGRCLDGSLPPCPPL